MKSLTLFFPFVILLLSTMDANAQCRMGSGPDFGDGIPYCSQPAPTAYVEPSGPQWATRWGAIAIDPNASKGGVGVASDMKSQRAAEKAAMKQCRNKGGGKTCRVQTAYDNQCGVIAWGDTYYSTANGDTIDSASELGLRECGKETSNCRIYYSNCSYPVRIR
jgi:Domain of unknown function (DUF4189)